MSVSPGGPPAYSEKPGVAPAGFAPAGSVPAPQYGGYQSGAAPGAPQIVGVTVVAPPTACTPYPTMVTCPQCHNVVETVVKYKSGLLTYLLATFIFLSTIGALGCCLIPFFTKGAKDVYHFCPNCNAPVGFFKRA